MSADRKRHQALLDKPRRLWTQADVKELRTKFAVFGGCCPRFAEDQVCDCMLVAQAAHRVAAPKTQRAGPTKARAGDSVKSHSGSKYVRKIRSCVTRKFIGEVDVYSVVDAYPMPMARSHAVKKLLCAGLRGKGDAARDIREAIDALKEDLKQLEAGGEDPQD